MPRPEPLGVAASCGLLVECCDLGSWGSMTLLSEYDAPAGVIRINERVLDAYRRTCAGNRSSDVRALMDFAITHELYHHYEAIGKVARLKTHTLREQAANTFARANVRVDAVLDAFLQARKA